MSYGQQSDYGGGYGQKQQSQKRDQPDREKFPMPKTFDDAKGHKVNFGKYKGGTINQIAKSDEGLEYLAWLGDSMNGEKFEDTYTAIQIFLSDPRVDRDLAAIEQKRQESR